jgi:peptidoglycan/xylan/chitin deacetylase (PgdA/CDA1 family)
MLDEKELSVSQRRDARRRAAADRRRQVRRRRIGALAAVAAVAVVVVVIIVATSGGDGGPSGANEASGGGGGKAANGAGAERRRAGEVRRAGGRGPTPAQRDAVASVIGYAPAIRKGGNRVKDVALTFDDGPGPDTPRIVSILNRYHVPATFFVLGNSAETHAGRVGLKAEATGDFALGDHTMTHPMLATMGAAGQEREIVEQARLLHSMGKPRPDLFRPPFGSFNATTLGVLRRERMLGVLWTADTKDYEQPGKKQIIYTAVSAAQPGAIVLMHDGPQGRSETADALPRIIVRLRQRHYKLVTVPQMMRENPPPRGTPVPTSLASGG